MAGERKIILRGRLPAAPEKYERENEQKTRRIIELMMVEEGAAAAEATTGVREDLELTTAELEPCEGEDGSFDLGGSSAMLIVVTSDGPARVRLYATADGRDADADRPTWSEPDAGIGLLLDLLLEETGGQTFLLQPATYLYNGDDPVADLIYYRITNYGDAAAALVITLTVIVMES